MSNDENKDTFLYKIICFFLFSLIPNYSYKLGKSDGTKQESKFGLYNPILNVKNNEVATKNNNLFAFLENINFTLIPQVNLTIDQIDKILSTLGELFKKEDYLESMSVNLKFALFILFKRLHLMLFNLKNLKFVNNYEDMKDCNGLLKKMTDHDITLMNKSYSSLFDKICFIRLNTILSKHCVMDKLLTLSFDFLNKKLDSDAMDVTNYFTFLNKYYKSTIEIHAQKQNFDLKPFYDEEKFNLFN